MLGMWATLKGLIAMMIGGLGSIPGAVVGGLVLGVIEVHSQSLFGPQVRDLAAYGVLFVLLVLRPGGVLGTTRTTTAWAGGEGIDGRPPDRHPLQYRRDLLCRSVRLSAAADRGNLLRPTGLLRHRRLHGRHRHRDVAIAALARARCGRGDRCAAALFVGLPTLRLHGCSLPSPRSRLRRPCGSCSNCSAIRSCATANGRTERHRGFPQYPLHLRERCQRDAFHADHLRIARRDAVWIFSARTIAAWHRLSHDRGGRPARRHARLRCSR